MNTGNTLDPNGLESPETVFSYLKVEHAISNILLRRLKLCDPGNTNDLMEYWFELVFPGRSPKGSQSDTNNRQQAKEQFRSHIPEYTRAMMFVSFSECCDNMALWAHYGDKGCGVCLGFHFDLSIDDDRILQKVAYDKPVSLFLGNDSCDARPGEYYHEKIRQILTTKRSEWSYEKEWRLIVPLNYNRFEHGSGGMSFFRFLEAEIKEVVFGPKCSELDIGKISLACKKNGIDVPFFRMERRMRSEIKELDRSTLEQEHCAHGFPDNKGTAYHEKYVPCLLSRKKMSHYMDLVLLKQNAD